MKISYYELLGMIKEGNIPVRIKVCLVGNKKVVYIAEFESNYALVCYRIENEKEEDENYHYYLSECLIECSMFDKNIEIIVEEKEMEKLDVNKFHDIDELVYKIDELIDEIKKLKKE